MAREQVKELATRGVRPASIQGGTAQVVVQQAAEPKIMGLARSLSGVNKALSSYGQILGYQTEKGISQGEAEAARATLEEAEKNLDATGEKLVAEGTLPRSMLLGYQKGYRRRIGQRMATEGVLGRLTERETELDDPEADDNIVNNILQEEIESAWESLQGKPLAQQGFAQGIEKVRSLWLNNATKKRDAVIQQHNESMVVEELNRDFGDLLQSDLSDEELGQVHQKVKGQLDSLSADSKLTRQRVIELFWSGTAVPAISNLIVSDQPNRAEQMLENILTIDLTGKGGVLGNINREGAYIRSKAVELRNRIEAKRDQLERDSAKVEDNIFSLFTPAATAVFQGYSDYREDNAMAQDDVARALEGAGYEKGYAATLADQLIRSQDVEGFQRALAKYTSNEAKRNAYGKTLPKMTNFIIGLANQKQFFLSDEQNKEVVDDYVDRLDIDPGLNPGTHLANLGIGDPGTRLALSEAKAKRDKELWFTKTETHRDALKSFEDSLETIFETTFEPGDPDESNAWKITQVDPYIPQYVEAYNQRIREASAETSSIENTDERNKAMIQRVGEIKKDIQDDWRQWQEVLKVRHDAQDAITDKDKLYENLTEAEAEFFQVYTDKVFGIEKYFYLGVGAQVLKVTGIDAWEDLKQRKLGSFNSRANAIRYAESAEKIYKSGTVSVTPLVGKKHKATLKDSERKSVKEFAEAARVIFGYNHIDEVPSGVIIDPKITPLFSDTKALESFGQEWAEEFLKWQDSGGQNFADYPALTKLGTLTGIVTANAFNEFIATQKGLLSNGN